MTANSKIVLYSIKKKTMDTDMVTCQNFVASHHIISIIIVNKTHFIRIDHL